jgi:Transcriptional regulator, AbiEi antitoxin
MRRQRSFRRSMGCNIRVSLVAVSPEREQRPGISVIRGQVVMLPSRADGYLTTRDAARIAGVDPVTIRQWRKRGWLAPQGLDERGYPLHTADAVRAAEEKVRGHGLEASGVDPRRQRKPRAALACRSCSIPAPRSSRIRNWSLSSGRPPRTSRSRLRFSAGCPIPTTGSAPCDDRLGVRPFGRPTCHFPPVWSCSAVSCHALAVTVIAAVYVTGFAVFLYLARRPRAREGEESISLLRPGVT